MTIGAVIAVIVGFIVYTIGLVFGSRKYERQNIRNTIAEEQIKNRTEINKRISEYEMRKTDIEKRFSDSPAKLNLELSKLNLEYTDCTGAN